jgi:hypothetical protein
MYTKFSLKNLTGRYHSEDLDVDGKIILKRKKGGRLSIGFIWLRIGTDEELL